MAAKIIQFPGSARWRANPIVRQPEPPIEAGHFRAMRRSDGRYAILDDRRHFADATVAVVRTEGQARDSVAWYAGQDQDLGRQG
jgi:hypothetical protein